MRESTTSRSKIAGFLTASVVAVATGANWIVQGGRELSLDEGYSLSEASLKAGDLFGVIWSRELNGSLHTWITFLLGRSEPVFVRAISTLLMVIGLAIMYVFVTRILGSWAAFAAIVVLVANPILQLHMVTGRAYSLAFMLVCLSFLVLDFAVRKCGGIGFILWGVVAGVALYAHFLTALVLVGQTIWLVYYERRRWREWLLGLFALLVAAIPIVGFFLTDGAHRGQLPEVPPRSIQDFISAVLTTIAGEAKGSRPAQLAIGLITTALVVLGIRGRVRRCALLGALTFAAPMAILAFGSLHTPALIADSYLIFALPGVAIAMAAGVRSAQLRSRALGVAASTALVSVVLAAAVGSLSSALSASQVGLHPWARAMEAIGEGQLVTTVIPFEGHVARIYADAVGADFLTSEPTTPEEYLEESTYDTRSCDDIGESDRVIESGRALWLASTMSPDFELATRDIASCIGYRVGEPAQYGPVRIAVLVPQ